VFLLLAQALPLVSCSADAPSAPAGPPHPHIVLFVADDLSWHDLGPYGAKDVKTPHLDAFASQSMRFTQAVATSPTCTPSRCSIYTGLYPFRSGAHANHSTA
jgi:N-sulfoglucosamine sulfohydrolase